MLTVEPYYTVEPGKILTCTDHSFVFCGQILQFSETVLQLGNRLKYYLSLRYGGHLLKTRFLTRAANSLFATFNDVGPAMLFYLFQSHCLALYGCVLWKLSSDSLRVLEVAFNICLRHIWYLPLRTHIGILHSCADLQSVYNMIYLRSQKFLSRTSSSSSSLVCAVFRESPVYTFAGLNLVYGGRYKRVYMCDDKYCAESFVHC